MERIVGARAPVSRSLPLLEGSTMDMRVCVCVCALCPAQPKKEQDGTGGMACGGGSDSLLAGEDRLLTRLPKLGSREDKYTRAGL